MPPIQTTQITQDSVGNVGFAINSQAGTARNVPFMTASINVDENGNMGVFVQNGADSDKLNHVMTEAAFALINENNYPNNTTFDIY